MTKIMKLLIIIPFLLTFPFTVFAQSPNDNKNDEKVHLKVLEERIKHVEEKTKIGLEALEKGSSRQDNSLKGEIEALGKLMDRCVWFFVVFIVFIGSAVTFFGRKAIFAWIKESIQSRTNEEIEKYVTKEYISGLLKEKGEDAIKTLLSEFEERLKEKLSELDELREEYENSINTLGDKIKDHDINEPLPEEADKDLADFEGRLSQFKKEEKYSFEDWFYKGAAEFRKADYKKAVRSWSKALDIKSKPGVYNNRGIAYDRLGHYERAIEDYNKAIELDPKPAPTYTNRGVTYANLKHYERAIEDYNKAIELDPEFGSAYYNRGVTYANLKHYERAIEDYNKAIELDPEHLSAHENLCEARIIIGDYRGAFEYITKALSLSSDIKDKAICLYLKCVTDKLLNKDTTETEKEFNEIVQSKFTLTWSFDWIENWLNEVDISDDTKEFIINKTEILKKRKVN